MNLRIELEHEADGRWIAEVIDIPGVLAYGKLAKRQPPMLKLAVRVIAEQVEHGEAKSLPFTISFLHAA